MKLTETFFFMKSKFFTKNLLMCEPMIQRSFRGLSEQKLNSNSQINLLCVNGTIIDSISDFLVSFKIRFSVSIVGIPLKAINLCLNFIHAHFLLYLSNILLRFTLNHLLLPKLLKLYRSQECTRCFRDPFHHFSSCM